MLRHSLRRLLAAIAAVLVVGLTTAALGAAPASAARFDYCNKPVPAYTACDVVADSNSAYFYDNQAQYTGAGTVGVCQKVYLYATGAQISRRCRDTLVGTYGDLSGYTGRMFAYVGNDSAWTHTINGHAYY